MLNKNRAKTQEHHGHNLRETSRSHNGLGKGLYRILQREKNPSVSSSFVCRIYEWHNRTNSARSSGHLAMS